MCAARTVPYVLLALGAALLGAGLLPGCGDRGGGPVEGVLRVGHFPNVTHAQALVAHHLSRTGAGWFEPRLGVKVDWYVYNAGPSAMEALLSGALDATYVGPNPALNTHIRSRGDEVRVLSGSAYGGGALVIRPDAGIVGPEDFRGRRIATPQFGNTQDVSCRAWLRAQGYRVTATGGDVSVIPTPNPDQIRLFTGRDVDAVWTVEPWVTRLELEGGGKVFLEEKDSVTTILVASRRLLEERRDLARALADAHAELTEWVTAHPEEARAAVKAEIEAITRAPISTDLLERCWPRLRFSADATREMFERFVVSAQSVGFLEDAIPLDRLVERP